MECHRQSLSGLALAIRCDSVRIFARHERTLSKTEVFVEHGRGFRPVIARWFPIDGDTVGFQGVNGETWYGYVLSIKTLTWRPWAVQHDGWTEPYGIPVENHRFMNLDSFVSFK